MLTSIINQERISVMEYSSVGSLKRAYEKSEIAYLDAIEYLVEHFNYNNFKAEELVTEWGTNQSAT
jgi:hypothetical protein